MTEASIPEPARPAASEVASETLREAVLRRLAMLDRIAASGESEFSVPMARAELSKLATGWRLLLATHRPDADRKCMACPRSVWRRRWPCRVWQMAYQHLVDDRMPRQRWLDVFRRLRRTPRRA